MNIYLIDNPDVAKKCRQIINLRSECAKLQWSRTITNLPDDVVRALSTIRDFTENFLFNICNSDTLFIELTDAETDSMFELFKKSESVKNILGSSVVLHGKEAMDVQLMIKENENLLNLNKALLTGKNIVLL